VLSSRRIQAPKTQPLILRNHNLNGFAKLNRNHINTLACTYKRPKFGLLLGRPNFTRHTSSEVASNRL
jgi:hypothetical protein